MKQTLSPKMREKGLISLIADAKKQGFNPLLVQEYKEKADKLKEKAFDKLIKHLDSKSLSLFNDYFKFDTQCRILNIDKRLNTY